MPAIVAKNYGRLSVLPLPEIMVSVPEAAQSKDKIDFYDGVINRLGLTVTRSKLYDDLGVAQPAPDDDVVGPAQQPQGAFGGFPSIGAGMPNLEAAAAARAAFSGYPARDVDNAEALADKAGAAWLEPIFAALRKAADEGLTPAELKKKLDSLTPNTGALADGMQAVLLGGLLGKGEAVGAANPYGCNGNQHKCPQKGTTREIRTKKEPKRVWRVDQTKPIHNQINALADAIEQASNDGERLEAVIFRKEFGELTLDCGHPGRKNDTNNSQGVGVQHSLEKRHNVSARDIAEALLLGNVTAHRKKSRLNVWHKNVHVIIEKEMHKGSGRISKTKAKIQTAMYET